MPVLQHRPNSDCVIAVIYRLDIWTMGGWSINRIVTTPTATIAVIHLAAPPPNRRPMPVTAAAETLFMKYQHVAEMDAISIVCWRHRPVDRWNCIHQKIGRSNIRHYIYIYIYILQIANKRIRKRKMYNSLKRQTCRLSKWPTQSSSGLSTYSLNRNLLVLQVINEL